MQPGGEGGIATVLIGAPIGGDQGILDCIGCLVGIAGGAQGDRPESVPVPGHQDIEGLGIPIEVGSKELTIGEVVQPSAGHLPSLTSQPNEPAK